VFAVALPCWAARKMYPREPSGEEAYWRFRDWRDCEREFRLGMERRTGRLRWAGVVRNRGGEAEGFSDEKMAAVECGWE
jgi:hypothetical protein